MHHASQQRANFSCCTAVEEQVNGAGITGTLGVLLCLVILSPWAKFLTLYTSVPRLLRPLLHAAQALRQMENAADFGWHAVMGGGLLLAASQKSGTQSQQGASHPREGLCLLFDLTMLSQHHRSTA
jgi:hypothetical protein